MILNRENMRNKKVILILCLLVLVSGSVQAQRLKAVQNEKGRYGFMTEDGTVVIKYKYDEATPTLSQDQILRKLDEKGELTEDKLEDIMRAEKPNQKEQFKTSYDNIRQYFPKNYSNEQINNKIMELLEKYQKEWKQKIRDCR